MSIDISTLSAAELEKLRESIDGTIAARRAEERQRVIDQIRGILAENNMSWDDLPRARGGSSTRGSKVAPKYRDPNNPATTWSGRGRKPKWVEAHLAAGGSMESLEI
nr:H-NS histone family protein [Oceanococcus sp. HetDA_MAG_MS8]